MGWWTLKGWCCCYGKDLKKHADFHCEHCTYFKTMSDRKKKMYCSG